MARHAQPTTSTSKTAAKVALTTAVIGGGAALLGAGTASAATDAEWNQVAQCESGGNWQINTGNGYHGGLQFSPSTWSGHGGGQYAPYAHQATKEQQIVVAERVLASQGKGAWPTCGTVLSGPTARTAPATPSTPSLPKLKQQKQNPQADQAATTGDAIAQVKQNPELRGAAEALEKSGFQLDKGQLDLFNQNKGLLGL
ncbi:resuscitation-promoting factor [Gordonia hirsuta DSM 44140 = NBRC 16056]|uniref:Resuscitation-promoting factor n=1 Tax=Gordonia hirsuta DSM 44140 = NBRC 16056 TaxID=1121927 RepID=L7LFE1_9ACTN|nr:transglycosylase family protein [Gordonia hirsuta]GAC58778.1 resuscitation-promoting factor [Gordonia hirsuta DSM 44140 = NBRC 16056]